MTAISHANTIDEGIQNQECTQSALPMQEAEDIQAQNSRVHGEILATGNRGERAAILQELFQGVLTAEEIEGLLDA